jgi:hypothetical protein
LLIRYQEFFLGGWQYRLRLGVVRTRTARENGADQLVNSGAALRPPAPSALDEFSPRGHGIAASTSVDGYVRNAAYGAHKSLGLRLSPEPLAGHELEPRQDQTWSPRPLTVEELRARFREDAGMDPRETPGTLVDRYGRRLTDFDLDEQEERQRMPEPIPTSWQSPIMPDPPSAVMRHLTSGVLGLAIGLAIAVPGVLWYKGRIDPLALAGITAADLGRAFASSGSANFKARDAAVESPRAAMVKVDIAPVPEKVSPARSETVPQNVAAAPTAPVARVTPTPPPLAVPRYEPTPTPVTVARPTPSDIVTTTPVAPQVKPEVALLEDARRLIGDGDFPAARKVLENEAVASTPMARFLLAETFDPNFLAARGIRSVRAEVPRAVELYKAALDGGVEAARQRLNALKP